MIFAVADLLGVKELLFLTAAQNSPSVSLDLQFGKIRTRSSGVTTTAKACFWFV